jgi:hypothetical protein
MGDQPDFKVASYTGEMWINFLARDSANSVTGFSFLGLQIVLLTIATWFSRISCYIKQFKYFFLQQPILNKHCWI